MSENQFIKEVRSGARFLVADFLPSSDSTQIRLACLTPKDVNDIPQVLRTTALAATRSYVYIVEGDLGGGESPSVEFGGEESVPTEEIVAHVRKFLTWANSNWPIEARFVKGAICDLEAARMSLDHDLRPGGFITEAELFAPGAGGSAVSLQPDAAPLGRTVVVAVRPDGFTFLGSSGPMPEPEGSVVSLGEFKMPGREK